MSAASRKNPVLRAGMLGLICLLAARPSLAYWDFLPTPLEWASWPEYCQVQYQWANAGHFRDYANRFPESQLDSWRARLGTETFTDLHHYCASVIYLSRARVTAQRNEKANLLRRAYDDAIYTFSQADSAGALYPTMAGTLAQIQMEQGEVGDAMETLNASIRAQPDRPQPYLMLALAQRKQGRLDLAKDVLEKATATVGQDSVELQYNLGLINIELGALDEAVENAKRVYAKDYPLPGLRNKLKKLGRWPPPP
jgi:tetratricopeptide (TPR) repeat protein